MDDQYVFDWCGLRWLFLAALFCLLFWVGVAYGAYRAVDSMTDDPPGHTCTYSGVTIDPNSGTSSAACVQKP